MNAASTAHGYTLVLPPGWTRVPLRDGAEAAIADIVRLSFAGHTSEAHSDQRQLLRRHLREVVSNAAANSGLDLYLPTELSHGFTVAASFVVAEFSFASMETPDPGHVLARIVAKGGDTRTIPLADATAARTESIAPSDPGRGLPFGSRRIDYVLPVPKDADRWLVVTFSTIGQGDPQDDFAILLVELFDAIMTTFRWTS